MKSEIWNIEKLRNWEQNPRSIKAKDFERLKQQITDLKEFKPLIVTPDGEVLGGNMRLRAYRDLGIKEVWVSVVDPKDDMGKLKYALADNDRAGYYDDDLLANLSSAYPDFDWGNYAVDIIPPQSLDDWINANKEVVEDEVPEVESSEAVSKLGEVYQLGRHRLMCGDSTKIEDVEKLMDGKKADMVFTDPPYGVDYEGKTKDKLKIENDKTTDIFERALPNYVVVSKAGAAYYICCPAGNNFIDFIRPFAEYCYQSSTIIWAKNSLVLGHGDYHYQHEPILYGWAKGASHSFYGDRTQTTLWHIDRPTQSKEHPTMKPIALITKALENSSKHEDIVLDLFCGSGSTLIACEQTNRVCYGMELDPHYCDVIRKRYAKFIGKEDEWEKITQRVEK